MAEAHRSCSVYDLIKKNAWEELRGNLEKQIQANPSLSGLEGATNARLKPGNTWRITGIRSWLPDPVETPLRVNTELIRTVQPEFTPYGMIYKPYADDVVVYSLDSSPAPMAADMEIALEAAVEAYDISTKNDEGKVSVHTTTKRFILPAHLDMNRISLELGILEPGRPFSSGHDRIYLDDYLLPEQWDARGADRLSRRIISEFMPECLRFKIPLDAYELVRRMGLHLQWKLLSHDFGILGEIFDRGCRTHVIEIHSREENDNFYAEAGTILLDDRLRTANHYPMEVIYTTIIHECIHWYKDRMFIALQNAFTPKSKLSVCRNSPAAHRSGLFEPEAPSDLDFRIPDDLMEAQALAIPPHILINAESGREKVSDIVNSYGGMITEDNYFPIIEEMRAFFSVTRYAADRRLREFGYRIPVIRGSSRHFTYQHRENSGIIYDISIDRLLELNDEEKYPDFAQRIRTGRYIYADSRLCLNTDEFIEFDAAGMPHLTGAALGKPASCCIPFRAVSGKDPDMGMGAMAASRPKAEPVLRVPEEPSPNLEQDTASYESAMDIMEELKKKKLGEEMDYHRKHPVLVTYEQWSDRSFVSVDRLKKLCKDPVRPKPEYSTFLRSLLGLHLDPWFSIPLIQKAKVKEPDDADQKRAIDTVLYMFYKHPILEIHRILYRRGYQLIEPNELEKEGLNEMGEIDEQ